MTLMFRLTQPSVFEAHLEDDGEIVQMVGLFELKEGRWLYTDLGQENEEGSKTVASMDYGENLLEAMQQLTHKKIRR